MNPPCGIITWGSLCVIGLRTFSIYSIESFRKVVTMTNCGSQLVHMRDSNVDSSLNILEKLGGRNNKKFGEGPKQRTANRGRKETETNCVT